MDNLITTSRIKAHNACKRLHHYKYVLGVQSVNKAESLQLGTLVHAGLDQWWNKQQSPLQSSRIYSDAIDPIINAKKRVMLAGYDSVYNHNEYETVAIEKQFEIQLTKVPGSPLLRNLRFSGKIDKIVKRVSDGTLWLVEHKTSSEDLSPGSEYWQRLRMDTQVSNYILAAKVTGYDVQGVLYDVLRKPTIKRAMATPMENRKYTKEGKLYANLREADETVEEYETRMAEAVSQNPGAFYGRAEVVRTEEELREAAIDLNANAIDIRRSVKQGIKTRNPMSCHLYDRKCEFWGVCTGCASIEDETLFTIRKIHPELDIKSSPSFNALKYVIDSISDDQLAMENGAR